MFRSIIKPIAVLLSISGLVVIIGSSLMVFLGHTTIATFKTWVLVASIIWFVTSPLWMIKRKTSNENN